MAKKLGPLDEHGMHTVIETDDSSEKPEPKPGDADYDWSAHYGDAELYTHTFADGTVVALKTFGSIFSKTWMYKIRHLHTEVDVEMAAIERGACPEANMVLENLDADGDSDPIDELFKAWSTNATAPAEGEEGLTSGE